MRAGLVAARDERNSLFLNCFQCRSNVFRALDPGRIAARPDKDKVIIHDVEPLDAMSFGHEFFFLRFGMHQNNVGIAAPRGIERLPGPLSDHLHVDSRLGFEQRQDISEQTGILCRCRRGHDNGFVLRGGRRRERCRKQRECNGKRNVAMCHDMSLCLFKRRGRHARKPQPPALTGS